MEPLVFSHPWAWAPVALALAFAFSNGFRDSSTIVATVVSTRTLSPAAAFGLCAVCEFLGALLIGHAITATVGAAVMGGNVAPKGHEMIWVLGCGIGAALLWGTVSWWRAWPISNSQALVGGLAGAGLVVWGPGQLRDPVKWTVLLVLITSPILGFLISTTITTLARKAGEWMTPKAKRYTRAIHLVGCLGVATAHGSIDGQMVAALFVLALAGAVAEGPLKAPFAARLTVAAVIACGVLMGGRRILRRMGMKFYRIRDMQGVGAQMSSVGTLIGCAIAGFPASTTQVVSGSIVGAGVAKNPRSVRWLAVREIVLSWVLTLPVTAILSAGFIEMFRALGAAR